MLLQQATIECDRVAASLSVDVLTAGWTGQGWFYEAGRRASKPWSDEAELASYEFGTCGAYDRLGAVISVGVLPSDHVPGVNTVFTCDDYASSEVLTYAVGVTDTDGRPADCRIWGADPTALQEGAWDLPHAASFDLGACAIGAPAGD